MASGSSGRIFTSRSGGGAGGRPFGTTRFVVGRLAPPRAVAAGFLGAGFLATDARTRAAFVGRLTVGRLTVGRLTAARPAADFFAGRAAFLPRRPAATVVLATALAPGLPAGLATRSPAGPAPVLGAGFVAARAAAFRPAAAFPRLSGFAAATAFGGRADLPRFAAFAGLAGGAGFTGVGRLVAADGCGVAVVVARLLRGAGWSGADFTTAGAVVASARSLRRSREVGAPGIVVGSVARRVEVRRRPVSPLPRSATRRSPSLAVVR